MILDAYVQIATQVIKKHNIEIVHEKYKIKTINEDRYLKIRIRVDQPVLMAGQKNLGRVGPPIMTLHMNK